MHSQIFCLILFIFGGGLLWSCVAVEHQYHSSSLSTSSPLPRHLGYQKAANSFLKLPKMRARIAMNENDGRRKVRIVVPQHQLRGPYNPKQFQSKSYSVQNEIPYSIYEHNNPGYYSDPVRNFVKTLFKTRKANEPTAAALQGQRYPVRPFRNFPPSSQDHQFRRSALMAQNSHGRSEYSHQPNRIYQGQQPSYHLQESKIESPSFHKNHHHPTLENLNRPFYYNKNYKPPQSNPPSVTNYFSPDNYFEESAKLPQTAALKTQGYLPDIPFSGIFQKQSSVLRPAGLFFKTTIHDPQNNKASSSNVQQTTSTSDNSGNFKATEYMNFMRSEDYFLPKKPIQRYKTEVYIQPSISTEFRPSTPIFENQEAFITASHSSLPKEDTGFHQAKPLLVQQSAPVTQYTNYHVKNPKYANKEPAPSQSSVFKSTKIEFTPSDAVTAESIEDSDDVDQPQINDIRENSHDQNPYYSSEAEADRRSGQNGFEGDDEEYETEDFSSENYPKTHPGIKTHATSEQTEMSNLYEKMTRQRNQFPEGNTKNDASNFGEDANECVKQCYEKYDETEHPVCGSDERTYGSEKEFNCIKACRQDGDDTQISHQGHCKETDE